MSSCRSAQILRAAVAQRMLWHTLLMSTRKHISLVDYRAFALLVITPAVDGTRTSRVYMQEEEAEIRRDQIR